MIKAAKENDVYIEVNIGGFRRGIQKLGDELRYPYPFDKFWKLVKKNGNKIIVSFYVNCAVFRINKRYVSYCTIAVIVFL